MDGRVAVQQPPLDLLPRSIGPEKVTAHTLRHPSQRQRASVTPLSRRSYVVDDRIYSLVA